MNTHPQSPLNAASWIWLDQNRPSPHQYVCFRKSFSLSTKFKPARLLISVDSDFVLFVNGHEAGRGQFSDYPEHKTYTGLEIGRLLKKGRNLLSVLAYYRGADSSEHRAGRPGLIVALQAGHHTIVSDDTWRARLHPAFRSGSMPRVTNQLGFTVHFDARRDLDWHRPGSSKSGWSPAAVQAGATNGFWSDLLPRPVPVLRVERPVTVSVVTQGSFIRKAEKGSTACMIGCDALTVQTATEVFANPQLELSARYVTRPPMPSDFLGCHAATVGLTILPPAAGMTGRFIIVDVGREEVGLLTFSVDAPAGAVLDIAHGEHLDDGRVRAFIHGRNFADRYICRSGRNEFTLPFRRLGARYLEVHFHRFREPIRLRYVGLRPLTLPLTRTGRFQTTDPLANRTYATGVRTLELCMHEHYEDCPWREQSLYAYDSRNQALYGYYAFGNYDFAATSFDLLGRGIRPDGLLELCAPARVPVDIPIFSMVWITALAEHWLHSGSPRLFRTYGSQIEGMLDRILRNRDPVRGLYRLPAIRDVWHFYEWTDGLAGQIGGERPGDRLDAAYNLNFHETLGSYAWMLEQNGQKAKARRIVTLRDALGQAIHAAFWSPGRRAYATYLKANRPSGFHDHIQALALNAGIVPKKVVPQVLSTLHARRFPPLTLSSLLYLVKGLMPINPSARRLVSDSIRRHWEPMVCAGATSFWETQYGGHDFSQAGSLCHGWSALPVYYDQAWVLGIRPIEPGFRRFVISPYPDRFTEAGGTVPTPAGPIRIEWRRSDRGLIVKATGPRNLTAVLSRLPETRVWRATYNGHRLRV